MIPLFIYRITNTRNGKVYIGQTRKTIEERMQAHLQEASSGKGFHLHEAIRKWGWDSFRVDIIAETEDESVLNDLEEYYIHKYDSMNPSKGYNLAPGGTSNPMFSKLVAQKHDEKMRSPQVRKQISKSMRKYLRDSGRMEEYAKNAQDGFRKFQQSDRYSQYLAKLKQFQISPSHMDKLNKAKFKSVYCINEVGEVVQTFDSVKAAAQWAINNGHSGNSKDVCSVCGMIKRSYDRDSYEYGLKWIYECRDYRKL